ncbi:MAG: hypothetical protein ACLQU3_22075, partial [Limisphaerales bacterium]
MTPLNTPPARRVSKVLPASEIVAYDWTGGLKLHQMVRPRQGALFWLHSEFLLFVVSAAPARHSI